MKERIKRALGYRRPGRTAVVLAGLLGVLLVCGLGCDPIYEPLPEETPALRVQTSLPIPGREVPDPAELGDWTAPEDASTLTVQSEAEIPYWRKIYPAGPTADAMPLPSWSGEDSPNWFTLVQPEATLELYLDCEEAPDRVVCTEYLYDGNSRTWTAPLELEGPSGLNGVDGQYWMQLARRSDSIGRGMEYRLLSVSCIWDNGRDTRTLEYPVLLRLPSVAADDPMRTPIILAEWNRVEPGEQADLEYGTYVNITNPRGRNGSYALTRSRSETGRRSFVSGSDVSADSHGGFGFRVTPIDEGNDIYQDQEQFYTLTYTWEDGTEETYSFQLYAALAEPEVDRNNTHIKPALSGEWKDLGALLPAPAEWADWDLAGRDEAVNMECAEIRFVEFPTPRLGWAVASVGRGVGNADTYVYRSFDGGNSWVETGHPEGQVIHWYPSAFYADRQDPNKALLAFEVFDGAPVCRTTDGGATWEILDLPLPEDARECVEIRSDTVLLFSTHRDMDSRDVFYSIDNGTTWKCVSRLEDPENISLEDLPPAPWAVEYGSGREYLDVLPYWYAPIAPIGAIREAGITLYSFETFDPEEAERGTLLLRTGDHLDRLPIPYARMPRIAQAGMDLADYDGDGEEELALTLLEGTGTGTSIYGLYLLERSGEGWRLSASLPGSEAADRLDLSQYDVPEEAVVGAIVSFDTDGDRITISVGLCSKNAPYTVDYIGGLAGSVTYNGTDLALGPMTYETEGW